MPSLSAIATKRLFRAMLKREFASKEHAVRHFRRVLDHAPFPSYLPLGVSARKMNFAGVPCERLAPRKPGLTILHLHGGAFIGGKLGTYHPFCGAMARRLQAQVILPDYRLAPEHPFPAAPDDCLAVYRELIDCGTNPANLVVTGDSAGGNLTLVTLQCALAEGLPMPRCAVLISPGADLGGTAASLAENDRCDVMLSQHVIQMMGEVYLQGHDRSDPRVSPLHGEFEGLPPLLICASDEECLRDDAYAVAARARAAGTSARLLMRPDTPHAWPIFFPLVAEARADMKKITEFILNARH
ncbi:alpha/beta hydrolase [Nevskia sp.]|uniref:alpha/beta hydrolase n=1 Tax=Nevskia sp. TaxID=1929292 RepID=UPI0025EF1B6E|nr:alpha/beta hydrolase [Nevskia sp.]